MTFSTRSGDALAAGGRVLVPLARSTRLGSSRAGVALAWSRPWGVLVAEGATTRLVRVRDVTRRLQLGILAAGLVAALLLRGRGSRRRRAPRR